MNAAGLSRHLRTGFSAALLTLVGAFPTAGADWPQYRGPTHNGTSTDHILKEWTGSVTNPVWRVLVPNCLSSLTVSGGRVFTQARRNINGAPKEFIVALSATNGAELWATNLDDALYPNGGVGPDDGPRSTPSVDGDSVFISTSYLKLYRLNITNGAVIWQKNLTTLYGASGIGYQNCASPLIENGLIFLNTHFNTDHLTLMALRTSDGSLAWRSENEGLTHSTPVLANIHGVRQVIFATQSGLMSLNPDTGARLWRTNYPFTYSTSIGVSPVVWEDVVFVCGAHAYGMGSVVVQATLTNDTWTATRLWWTNNTAAHWMTPVAREGFLYGQFGIQQFDSPTAQLKCIDMRTGAVKWSANGFGRGGTLLVDEHILSITERGELILVSPNTDAYTEVARFLAIPNYDQNTNRCWNVPAVADGRVYVRSTAYVACFDLALPGLKLDPPAFVAPSQLQLSVRSINGAPIDSNRLNGLTVRASSDVTQSLTQWLALTNSLTLTNGVVRLGDLDSASQTQQFFIVTEPK
jgi:outer membrane protein assembly factor BamB